MFFFVGLDQIINDFRRCISFPKICVVVGLNAFKVQTSDASDYLVFCGVFSFEVGANLSQIEGKGLMRKTLLINNTAENTFYTPNCSKLLRLFFGSLLVHCLHEVDVVDSIVPNRAANDQLASTGTTL